MIKSNAVSVPGILNAFNQAAIALMEGYEGEEDDD